MVGRLERDGYITRDKDRTIAFTASGAEHAEGIVRRHRLIERFLTDVLGVPWDEVHEEAERLEHAMSPVLEERMLAAIGDAKTCPHGHPIVAGARLAGVPLADVEVGASVRVLRFENEAEDLLHYLKASGLEPGLEGASSSATTSRSQGSSAVAARRRQTVRSPIRHRRKHGRPRQSRDRPALGRRSTRTASGRRQPRADWRRDCLPQSGRSGQRAVGRGEARHALVDLLGRDAGVGEAQRVLAALEQEVGALHERHPAFGGGAGAGR